MKKWICSVCGSDRVSWPVWRMLNVPLAEDKLEPLYDDATTGTWCHGCEERTGLDCTLASPRGARNVELREVTAHALYECGICGCYHPVDWNGDCHDDANRYGDPEDYAARNGVRVDDVDVQDMPDDTESVAERLKTAPIIQTPQAWTGTCVVCKAPLDALSRYSHPGEGCEAYIEEFGEPDDTEGEEA